MRKNKIFVNKIERKLGNNQKYCDIDEIENINNSENEKEIYKTENKLTVREKIDKLLDRNGYIFNVNVKIITHDNIEYKTKIAGNINNNLITMNNDIINISDIKDLIIEDSK